MTPNPVITPISLNFCCICGNRLVQEWDGERMQPYCSQCNRHFYHNPIPACCIFVADDAGRLLMVQRAVEPCIGHWCLPGGFMEIHETGEECALRELCEETGLVADHAQLIGAGVSRTQDRTVLVLGYYVKQWCGTPKHGSDASDLRFWGKEERPIIPFDAHRELLQLYDARFNG